MAGKDAGKDLFGMGGDEQEGDVDAYIIVQLTPADGWRAAFTDSTNKSGVRILGIAAFALVEIIPQQINPEGHIPQRAVRPLVANEHGEVDDVEAFDDFICLIAPGMEVQPTVEFALKTRDD